MGTLTAKQIEFVGMRAPSNGRPLEVTLCVDGVRRAGTSSNGTEDGFKDAFSKASGLEFKGWFSEMPPVDGGVHNLLRRNILRGQRQPSAFDVHGLRLRHGRRSESAAAGGRRGRQHKQGSLRGDDGQTETQNQNQEAQRAIASRATRARGRLQAPVRRLEREA
jgi:hypothetical protein